MRQKKEKKKGKKRSFQRSVFRSTKKFWYQMRFVLISAAFGLFFVICHFENEIKNFANHWERFLKAFMSDPKTGK